MPKVPCGAARYRDGVALPRASRENTGSQFCVSLLRTYTSLLTGSMYTPHNISARVLGPEMKRFGSDKRARGGVVSRRSYYRTGHRFSSVGRSILFYGQIATAPHA